MGCCHHAQTVAGGDSAFSVDASRITFGPGCLGEIGDRAAALGMRRVALFTDRRIAALPYLSRVRESLRGAGCEVEVFDAVRVEPTDRSFAEAIAFARELAPDGYVSLGGGSVIDTAKAANLFTTHPADVMDYVNAPVGEGRS